MICDEYMGRQTFQDFQWIIVDDVKEQAYQPERADYIIRPAPFWKEDSYTLGRNLIEGLELVDPDEPGIVVLVEDDDWYHPAYFSLMEHLASSLPAETKLWGEGWTRYYNVKWRIFKTNQNDHHASMCSTVFRNDFIPDVIETIRTVSPEKTSFDKILFQRYRDISVINKTNFVVGIKGLPGRPGIGKGHRANAKKRMARDPSLGMLHLWIGDDAKRYEEFSFHDEPPKKESTFSVVKNAPLTKTCGIFRRQGKLPDLSCFAAGVFVHGYQADLVDVPHSTATMGQLNGYDLVLLSGGLRRNSGMNRKLWEHYRGQETPVIICELGRVAKGTIMTFVNKRPWLPPRDDLPRHRILKLGIEQKKRTRGENILIAGQHWDMDNQLAPYISAMMDHSDRKVIFRPHPNMYDDWQREKYDVPCHEISIGGDRLDENSMATLEEDLRDAWCVVTYSSIVGLQAMLQGIPVMAKPAAVYWENAYPMTVETAKFVEDFMPPGWFDLQALMRRISHMLWTPEEISSGQAFAFLKEFL